MVCLFTGVNKNICFSYTQCYHHLPVLKVTFFASINFFFNVITSFFNRMKLLAYSFIGVISSWSIKSQTNDILLRERGPVTVSASLLCCPQWLKNIQQALLLCQHIGNPAGHTHKYYTVLYCTVLPHGWLRFNQYLAGQTYAHTVYAHRHTH